MSELIVIKLITAVSVENVALHDISKQRMLHPLSSHITAANQNERPEGTQDGNRMPAIK